MNLSLFSFLLGHLQTSCEAKFMVTIPLDESEGKSKEYLFVLYLVEDFENEKVKIPSPKAPSSLSSLLKI